MALPISAAAIVILLLLAAMPAPSPLRADPVLRPNAAVTFYLFGAASAGWGFTPTSLTSPGPTITVNAFDGVTLNLHGVDSATHNFYVDYNGNGNPDPVGEPISPDFRSASPATLTFTADRAGTFTYYCEYHQGKMFGTFVAVATNTRPSAAISMPEGSQDWTGSTSHWIWWNMSDVEDLNPALTVFLNYTSSAGSGAIAGPLPGTANPNSHDWGLPSITATDVVVNLTVLDTGGLAGWDEASVPVIDSTAPQVTATLPAAGATDVPTTAIVRITWSEPMDLTAAGSVVSFGLQALPSGSWVQGAFSWNFPLNTILTFTPSSPLLVGSQYRASANTSATDASDPGNPLAAAHTWTFTTGTGGDAEPPQISSVSVVPGVQAVGGAVNVSAIVTDNVALAGVWLETQPPSGAVENVSMVPGAGDSYYVNRTYGGAGTYAFTIWASDTSGLWDSATGTFVVQDTEPPTILHTPPSSLGLGEPLNVSAIVQDNGSLAQVRLNWTDPSGRTSNVTMASIGAVYWYKIPLQLRPGTMRYFVWARDSDGNVAMTPVTVLPIQAPAATILLYGTAAGGWGFGLDNITSPGPTIRAALGADVSLLLLPADGMRHNFFVDYDGNGVPGTSEPISANFSDRGVTLSFVAARAGTFTYYCQFHVTTMRGTFVVGEEGLAPGFSPLVIGAALGLGVAASAAAVILLRRRRAPPKPGQP